VGEVLPTGEEPYQRSSPLRDVIAEGTAQHRITGLEGIQDRTLGHLAFDVELHLVLDMSQSSQMCREHDSNHGSV
jgi:hypothetical protein